VNRVPAFDRATLHVLGLEHVEHFTNPLSDLLEFGIGFIRLRGCQRKNGYQNCSEAG
jgi:hypothetical protein